MTASPLLPTHASFTLPRIPPFRLVQFTGGLSSWPEGASQGLWLTMGVKHLGTQWETYLCRRPHPYPQKHPEEPLLEVPRWLQEVGAMMVLNVALDDRFTPAEQTRQRRFGGR